MTSNDTMREAAWLEYCNRRGIDPSDARGAEHKYCFNQSWQASTLVERERCAKVAEKHLTGYKIEGAGFSEPKVTCAYSSDLAQAIRSGE